MTRNHSRSQLPKGKTRSRQRVGLPFFAEDPDLTPGLCWEQKQQQQSVNRL